MVPILYILGLLAGYGLYKWASGRLRGIPGPWGIPVLGYFPWLGSKLNLSLTALSHRYGPVYQLQMGSRHIVVLSGQRAVREASSGTKGADFAGRPPFHTMRLFGVYGATGFPPAQKMYKSMTLKAMGMFANNKRRELENTAYLAFDMLVEEFRLKNGQAFDPKLTLYDVVWTIMGFICYGRNFHRNDPEVHHCFGQV